MAQTGYTPISLYYSATASAAPTAGNLVAGELAINTADGKLFYKDSAGVVQVIASKSTGTAGGSNTQIQYNSSGALAGSSSFVFDGTNVGIGTSSPQSSLQVSGAMVAAPTGLGAHIGVQSNYAVIQLNGDASAGSIIDFSQSGTDYLGRILYSNSTNAMLFSTNNTERMRIDTSGNVGIGTISPTEKLSVNGGLVVTGAYTGASNGGAINFSYASNAGTIYSLDPTVAWKSLDIGGSQLTFGTGGSERMRIDSSGNVGIGVSSIDSKFEVDGGGSLGVVRFFYNGASINFFDTDTHVFRNAATVERMRIDSSGNLLVGTTTSQGKVTVTQNANTPTAHINNLNASFSDTSVIIYTSRTTTNSSFNQLACYNGNFSGQFLIRDSGNAVNTNNSYGAVSDIKLKENIVDATPKLDDLMKVKVRQYNLKSSPEHKQIGVVAQELEQVFAGLVEESADKDIDGNDLGTTTKQVKYSVFVPMLIKAIQELNAKVTALEAKLAAK